MSEFTHNETLFSSDDGIPLEFNIQYVKDKASIKSLIERGGGLCTLKDDVIHIVSPGATFLSVKPGINLVSTSFICDSVKENHLLDIDEYRFVINETAASDMSDNRENVIVDQEEQKCKDDIVNSTVDVNDSNKTLSSSSLTCPNSNHDFDFQDSENPDNHVTDNKKKNPVVSLQTDDINSKPEANMIEKKCNEGQVCTLTCPNSNHEFDFQDRENPDKHDTDNEKNNPVTSSQPDDISLKPEKNMIEKECNEVCINADNLKSHQTSIDNAVRENRKVLSISDNKQVLNYSNQEAVKQNDQDVSADDEIVSSSLPDNDVSDIVLKKTQENPAERDDDCLSESHRVSSSADAQVSPKAPSNMSAEIFDGSFNVPDSASQSTKRQQYINDLEKEVEQILQKPSPKSMQDKITFIKYICTLKKLEPAIVLQTLQNF